jgi:hypothetical protein
MIVRHFSADFQAARRAGVSDSRPKRQKRLWGFWFESSKSMMPGLAKCRTQCAEAERNCRLLVTVERCLIVSCRSTHIVWLRLHCIGHESSTTVALGVARYVGLTFFTSAVQSGVHGLYVDCACALDRVVAAYAIFCATLPFYVYMHVYQDFAWKSNYILHISLQRRLVTVQVIIVLRSLWKRMGSEWSKRPQIHNASDRQRSHDTSVVAEWSNALDLNCAQCIQLSSLFGGNGSNPFDGVISIRFYSFWQMICLSSCYMLEYNQKVQRHVFVIYALPFFAVIVNPLTPISFAKRSA